MMNRIRLLLVCETLAFAGAASIHFGLLSHGYEHSKAGTAESVIAAVLLIGLVLTLVLPKSTRFIALVVQLFALVGTLVGIFTIAIGVGPRTLPDVTYHIAIVLVLVWGLICTRRWQVPPIGSN
jgi:hypothetical protein